MSSSLDVNQIFAWLTTDEYWCRGGPLLSSGFHLSCVVGTCDTNLSAKGFHFTKNSDISRFICWWYQWLVCFCFANRSSLISNRIYIRRLYFAQNPRISQIIFFSRGQFCECVWTHRICRKLRYDGWRSVCESIGYFSVGSTREACCLLFIRCIFVEEADFLYS